MNKNKKHGFTLIELLVVIAIIGILSSVVISSINSARAKARDVQRLSDMRQVQTALEAYANDNGGSYPSTGTSWWGNCSVYGSHGNSGANGWVPGLAPNYINVLPSDPAQVIGGGDCYMYLYISNGTDYMILSHYRAESYSSSNNPKPRPLVPTAPSFSIYTPGARMW